MGNRAVGWLSSAADFLLVVESEVGSVSVERFGVAVDRHGGDILDRGGSGGMCPPSTSVEDFAAKSVRPCHMVSGVHYRYSEGSLSFRLVWPQGLRLEVRPCKSVHCHKCAVLLATICADLDVDCP